MTATEKEIKDRLKGIEAVDREIVGLRRSVRKSHEEFAKARVNVAKAVEALGGPLLEEQTHMKEETHRTPKPR